MEKGNLKALGGGALLAFADKHLLERTSPDHIQCFTVSNDPGQLSDDNLAVARFNLAVGEVGRI